MKVAICGGGQLARMLAHAGQQLGLDVAVLGAAADEPAAQVVARFIIGSDRDAAVAALATGIDAVTIENEWVDVDLLRRLEATGSRVFPAPGALERLRDKFVQRTLLASFGWPQPPFMAVASMDQLRQAAERFGFPFVVKRCRGGYDGKGVRLVEGWRQLDPTWLELGPSLLAEAHVAFDRELAVLVARTPRDDVAVYPVVETVQMGGVCELALAPATCEPALGHQASELAIDIARKLGLVGVTAVELFATPAGVLINEVAPRVHNSGHLTLDASVTSQFEQHWRAVFGWPLGSTRLHSAAAMANILARHDGARPEGLAAALAVPDVRLHWYGKRSARPGRKLGHITALAPDTATAVARAVEARARLRV